MKKWFKKKLNIIVRLIDKFNIYFVLPLLVSLLLLGLSNSYKNNVIGFVINIVFSILFIIYAAFVIYKICKKTIRNKSLIWVLVTSLVLIVLSYIIYYGGNSKTSMLFFRKNNVD